MTGLPWLLHGLKRTSHQPPSWVTSLHARQRSTLAFEQFICEPSATASSQPKAAGTQSSAPKHSLVFMHGLMGSSRNWRTFARKLGEAAAAATGSTWRTIQLDLRCHGASAQLHGIHPPHTLKAAAQDVRHFIQTELSACPPVALVGHSLGGKVLLELLKQTAHDQEHAPRTHTGEHRPSLLPPQAWVLDSQLGKVSLAQDAKTEVGRALQAVKDVPLPIPSRTWLTQHLKQDKGFSMALSQWLASNVAADPHGRLHWIFNTAGVTALYNDYMMTDYWDQLQHPAPGVALHMVVGGQSDRWSPPTLQRLNNIMAYHTTGKTQPSNPGLAYGATADTAGTAAEATAGVAGSAETPAAGPAEDSAEGTAQGPTAGAAGTAAGASTGTSAYSTHAPESERPHSHGSFMLHRLAKAGHNIHIDDPDGLLRLMLPQVIAAAGHPRVYCPT